MNTKVGVEILTEEEIDAHPIWKYEDSDDLYHQVMSFEDIPDDERDLFIRVNLFSPNGMKFKGYIGGIKDIICIRIFYNKEKFSFNINLIDMGLEAFKELSELIFENTQNHIVVSDIFPIKYETDIDLEGFRNVSGEFNAFKKIKDLRLLRWKNI